jgi:membrane-bound lytic murein transglycosylase A
MGSTFRQAGGATAKYPRFVNRPREWKVANKTISLKPTSFAAIEGWHQDDHDVAFRALLRSCHANPKPSYGSAAVLLGEGITRDAARIFFEEHYTPHFVADGNEGGLVTGYYEPEVEGSRKRGGDYQVPVYGKPDDLITLIDETKRARHKDRITGMRETPQGRGPHFTRAEIDSGALEGRALEILYLKDPVELFFMQVQGSGHVRLTDGSSVRLGFAARNGQPYASIGGILVKRGEGNPEQMTMQCLKAWLRADPDRGRALMQENRSYVFFTEIDGDEPIGAQDAPLTPGRSLAVDTQYHRLGTPIFVTAPDLATPEGIPFRRLMIAQDVGSAIRGKQRGDIFWGSGEEAGSIAGSTRHKAWFYVLLPKRGDSVARRMTQSAIAILARFARRMRGRGDSIKEICL